jgi:hypothetical protein
LDWSAAQTIETRFRRPALFQGADRGEAAAPFDRTIHRLPRRCSAF